MGQNDEQSMKRLVVVSYFFIQVTVILVFASLAFADSLKQSAPPPLPASFFGVLTAVNETLSPNITISAHINQKQYAQTTVFKHEGQWVYTLKIPADNPATEEIEGGRPGDKITLYINNKAVATNAWQGGTNSQLDLTLESVTRAQTEAARPFNLWFMLGTVVTLILVAVMIRYRQFVVVFIQSRYMNE
jgi:hypothetical protein